MPSILLLFFISVILSIKSKLNINNQEYETIICRGSFNAIVGYNESDFLETASEDNAITYWYTFFEKEKMWIPIKFTIDTPLGALVIKAREINDNSNEG